MLPETLITAIMLYFAELRNFHFLLFNPLLWVFWLILLWLLSKQWGYKKAFSFCLLVVLILLANTSLENYFKDTFAISDPIVIRTISILFIAGVSIYYFFIRSD